MGFSLFPRRDAAPSGGQSEFVSTIAVPPPAVAGRRSGTKNDSKSGRDNGESRFADSKPTVWSTALQAPLRNRPGLAQAHAAQPGDVPNPALHTANTAPPSPWVPRAAPASKLAAAAAQTPQSRLSDGAHADDGLQDRARSGPDSLASDWIHDSALMADSQPIPLQATPEPSLLPRARHTAAERAEQSLREPVAGPVDSQVAQPLLVAHAPQDRVPEASPGTTVLKATATAPAPAPAPAPSPRTESPSPAPTPAATPTDPLAALPTLAQLGRYALKRELPTEGLGQLHEAWDPLLGRALAVQTLHFQSNAKARASLDELFLKEARAIAGLNHPYIASVFDAGLAVQGVYFAQERLHGASLRQRLVEGWKFGPAASCQLVRRLADALGHAHGHGVLHGDIKPATVFITQRGKPKLVDFGVARVMQRSALAGLGAGQGAGLVDSNEATRHQGGSPHYMAPEQLQGNRLDARSDVYSLGVVLYELLAGRLAFNGDTPDQVAIAVLTNHPAPAHLLRPGLSADLAAIATKAMARNPADRFASAAEMAQALRQWFDTVKPAAPPVVEPAPSIRTSQPDLAPSRDDGPVTRPLPPYPKSAAAAVQNVPPAALLLEEPTAALPAWAVTAPTELSAPAVSVVAAGTPPAGPAATGASPQPRVKAQIRFLTGCVVVLAGLCGGLVAYLALR